MQLQKEKAYLIVEILNEFAPAMDNSTSQFNKMLALTDQFNKLTATFSNLPDEQLKDFMSFMSGFTDYINEGSSTYSSLSTFHKYLSNKATTLVEEYQSAAKGL